MYSLRLFGGIALEGESGPISGPALRQRLLAVLAILAVARDKGCSRDKLIGYLWSEADQERARHRLANAVYELRKSLGEEAVLGSREVLRLDPEVIKSDAWAFQDALDANELESAASLYEGPLLDGFHIDDGPEFERWLDSERQRLGERYAKAVEELARQAEAAGGYVGAVEWWAELVAYDRYNTRVAMRYMQAMAQSGDRANALQFAQEHERLLRDELDLEPDPQLVALAERLKREPAVGGGGTATTSDPTPVSSDQALARATRPRRFLTLRNVGLTAAAAVAVGLTWYVGWGSARGPAVENRSIAVLPLENLSPDPDDAYFADGIHGEIISLLGTIGDLRVISRTSVMGYKGRTANLRDIAEELGVENILEGTVRRSGDRLRITVELVAAESDEQVWSEVYERNATDIFAIQADVAQQVVSALSVALAREELERIEARPTEKLEAYDFYLRGLDYYGRSVSKTDLRVAQQMFEKATQLDSGFALAYARLSRTHSRMYWFRYDGSQERLQLAKRAVDRSLELQPELPEVHEALGWYYYYGFFDYERALQHFEIALSQQPRNSDLLQAMGYVERRRGNLQAHLDYLEKAKRFDPRNALILLNIAQTHSRMLRNYAEAERYFERALALAPDWPRAYGFKAWMYLCWEGNTDRARGVLEEAAGRGLDSIDDPFIGYRWIQVELFDADYEAALERLSSGSSIAFGTQFYYLPKALLAAQVYDLINEPELARQRYDSAAALLEAKLAETPDDSRLYGGLGIAYAGLGRVEEAIRTAEKGIDLVPVSKEAQRGLWRVEDLARVYVMVGESDAAIDQLDYLLSIPGEISVPLLRIDPIWDPLRDHPRFQALLEKYE